MAAANRWFCHIPRKTAHCYFNNVENVAGLTSVDFTAGKSQATDVQLLSPPQAEEQEYITLILSFHFLKVRDFLSKFCYSCYLKRNCIFF